MTQNKLSFESENLVVDYISFNITGLIDPEPIANYLFRAFGFNSTIIKRINGKWKSKDLNSDSRNQFQVSFRQHEYDPETKSFWVGAKIDFSSNNAAQLYSSIKTHQLNWDIFDLQRTSLSRFDLHYLRELKTNKQSQDIEIFI